MRKYNEYGYPIDDENEGEFQPNEYLTPREVMELLAIGRRMPIGQAGSVSGG